MCVEGEGETTETLLKIYCLIRIKKKLPENKGLLSIAPQYSVFRNSGICE
jgi:hypothetical protein